MTAREQHLHPVFEGVPEDHRVKGVHVSQAKSRAPMPSATAVPLLPVNMDRAVLQHGRSVTLFTNMCPL